MFPNLKAFGLKKIYIKKDYDKILETLNKFKEENKPIIVIIYEFETHQQRDGLYEMFKQSLQLMSSGG